MRHFEITFSLQIIVNLSQFRVPCYQFDVELTRIPQKTNVNYNMIKLFIFTFLKECGIRYYFNSLTPNVVFSIPMFQPSTDHMAEVSALS